MLGSTWLYVGASLLQPISADPIYQVCLAILMVVSFGLQLWRFTSLRNPKAAPWLVKSAFFFLGLFSQLLVLTAVKDLLGLIVDLPAPSNLAFVAIGFFLNALALRTALRGPVIKSVRLSTKGSSTQLTPEVSEQQRPLRIVQISDLHVGPIIQSEYVEKVVEQILSLKPDVLVATGDIGDGDPIQLSSHLAAFQKINIPKYYVTGNHEYYWSVESWVQEMEKVGFRHLLNAGERVQIDSTPSVWIAGVPDLQGARFLKNHVIQIDKSMEGSKSEDYKILLAHQPKVCKIAEPAGFDLMLNGHTHGGQFFPFTLFVGFFNPYSRGLNQHKNMKVYVNLGTGFWGPPLRLGAEAEITLFELSHP